jgi:fatty acid desaturase
MTRNSRTNRPGAPFESALDVRQELMRGLEVAVNDLRQLNAGQRRREFISFAALWIAGIVLSAFGHRTEYPTDAWLLSITGVICSAVALNAFVLLLHEGMHQTLSADPRWNRAASVLLGATVLISFSAYRVLHTRHHDYLGDRRDPDDYHNYTDKVWLVWLLHFVRLGLGSLLYLFLIPTLAVKHGTARERRNIFEEYLFLGLVYAVILNCLPFATLAIYWLAPLLVVGFMVAVRGLTQHGITDVEDPYLASRTLVAHPLVAFCLLNENYHLEHHLFPEVPSYRLAKLHELIWPRLPYVVTGRSYLGFIACFLRATLKLDERPIGFQRLKQGHAVRT